MSKIQWKNLPPSISSANLLPDNVTCRQTAYLKTCSSAPSSANAGRRKNKFSSLVRAMSDAGSEGNSVNLIRQNFVAWQIISQQLTLQLQQRCRSELAARRSRALSLGGQRKYQTTVSIDEIQNLKGPSTIINSNIVDPELESVENVATEEGSLLKVDAHIIPLQKLVERFNSNLTQGLTNDMVTQHHATFGQNKLTPSRPPSLLWMLTKQLLIGFNGILWIATLFAFLSYVSFS